MDTREVAARAARDEPRGVVTPGRERLLERMESGRALTLLWGPTGYGKSSLIEAWLAAHPATPVIRIGEPSDPDPEPYWVDVRARLGAAAPSRSVLVLDRLDRLDDPRLWPRLLHLRDDHPGLRVLGTARDPAPFWGYGMGRPDITVLTPAEFEFTADELGALWTARGTPDVSERTIRDGLARTGGHPALVDLTLHVGRVFGARLEWERPQAAALLAELTDRYVSTLLHDLPPEQQRAACLLACARQVSVGAAAALGLSEPEVVVGGLERAGLLYRPLGTQAPRWRFPPAVRTSLLRIATRDGGYPPTGASAALARWCADNGEPVDALHHATEARDWDLVRKLVLAHWVWIGVLDTEVLVRALVELPDELVHASPVWYHARELAARVLSDRPRKLIRMLSTGPDLEAYARDHSVADAVLAGTLRSVVFRWRGEFDESVRHHEQLAAMSMRLLDDLTEEAARAAYLPLLWLHLGQSSEFRGDRASAERFYRLASDGSGGLLDDIVGRQAAGHLALLEAVRGETEPARQWLDREAEHEEHPGWVGVAVGIPAACARVLVALDRLDVDAAEAAFACVPEPERALEYWSLVVYVGSQLDLLRGRPEVALDRLDRVATRFRKWMTPSSLAAPLLAAVTLDLRVAAGEAADVLAELDGAPDRLPPALTVVAAGAALLTGAPDSALARVRRLTARTGTDVRLTMDALLIEAAARLAVGDAPRARTAWNRAVGLSADSGLVRPFAGLPAATVRLLSETGMPAPASVLAHGCGVYPDPVPAVTLTDREAAVLEGVVRGDTVARIAETLFVSPNTVKTQRTSLYRKLGVHSRDEAVAAARRRGLI